MSKRNWKRTNSWLLVFSLLGGGVAAYIGPVRNIPFDAGPLVGTVVFFVGTLIMGAVSKANVGDSISLGYSPVPTPGNRLNNIYISGLSIVLSGTGIAIFGSFLDPALIVKGLYFTLPGFGALGGLFLVKVFRG